ncbi:MAG: PQQ-binding-like beta-propeller repeat protein [Desulfobacterales bacterium]|jgi:outer membrane protein assembly factor BamB
MSLLLRNVFWTLCLFTLVGCAAHGLPRWRNFQGDLPGQGYLSVDSGFAVSSAWTSNPYNITTASPVIGIDSDGREVIYVGTVDGELVALNSEDGKERWRRSFAPDTQSTAIISTPAISRNGNIYVVVIRRDADGRTRSILHKVDEFSRIRWSQALGDEGFTSGAPKVLVWGEDTLVFIYATVFVDGNPQGALLVLHDRGKAVELLDRKTLGTCQWGSHELQARSEDAVNTLTALWDFTSLFRPETADGGYSIPDIFVDPSVAVFTARKLPLIAIADNLCSMGAFEWDDGLTLVWRKFHPYEKHSSTSILPGGLMVFGRQNGSVLAHDMETGTKIWSYDAGQPVLATPAATDSYLFVVAKDHLKVLDQKDGSLVYDRGAPRQFRLPGQTLASPAVTQNRVYVSTSAMITFSYDLSTRSQDTNFRGNGLASIALGNNGAVYAVAADGRIHKYLGPK